VNIGDNEPSRIAIFEGDTPEELAEEFSKSNKISKETRRKLIDLI